MADGQKKKKSGARIRKRKSERNNENKMLSKRLFKFLETSNSDLACDSDSQVGCEFPMHEDLKESVSGSSPSQLELQEEEDIRSEIRDVLEGILKNVSVESAPSYFDHIPPSSPSPPPSPPHPPSPPPPAPPLADKVTFALNSRISVDSSNNTFDPSSIVGLELSVDEKLFLLKMEPCHPAKDILKNRTKQQGNRMRQCSQGIFYHDDGIKRKWVSYSLSMDAVYCIPCLLFTDATSRSDNRGNQGNAFVVNGFSNWKNQNERIHAHEASSVHKNAKVAAALFHEGLNMESLMDNQSKEREEERLAAVNNNREVLERILDVIFLLGKQGLAFRGHSENLAADAECNNGNFLQILQLLGKYDEKIDSHLQKVKHDQAKSRAQKKKGRGSKVTFMSDKSQNKLIRMIGDQITTVIVEMIKNCIGWSLIVDSTPDVAHKEQLSICVRIVGRGGLVSEHILACKEANSVTANGLFLIIIKAFELKGVSFEKLVAQTYDGASNMSGCYNGLQAIIREKIGNHILYVHCYAHSLNLVLKDTVSDDNNVVTLFEKLESLHNLVNRSMKVHKMFDDAQKDSGLEVLSVKRWSVGAPESFV